MDKDKMKILKNLTEREKKILKERFGVDLESNPDLTDVGTDLEITLERIKEIEEKALKKLEGDNKE